LPTKKQNVLVSAGGTATAWHLASLIRDRFELYFNLYVCDINPAHLIASSRLATQYVQVPRADAPEFRSVMLELFRKFSIDIYVPLVDADVYEFPADDHDLAGIGVRSTGVPRSMTEILSNKRRLSASLRRAGIATPRTFSSGEIFASTLDQFFVKPEEGFGSRDARPVDRDEALRVLEQNQGMLIQEFCRGPEITVEAFNGSCVKSICRERIETKAGVCTKARIFADRALQLLTERICATFDMPIAFCFQVMHGSNGEWLLTDLNPRLGAGTALSTEYGWSLAAASLACWGRLPLEPTQFADFGNRPVRSAGIPGMPDGRLECVSAWTWMERFSPAARGTSRR
jgi:hypothetical protein